MPPRAKRFKIIDLLMRAAGRAQCSRWEAAAGGALLSLRDSGFFWERGGVKDEGNRKASWLRMTPGLGTLQGRCCSEV